MTGLRAGASLTRFVGYRAGAACSAYPTLWEAPVFTERTSVGLDVHARSVAAAAIDGATGELFQAKLTPSYDHITSWLKQSRVRWRWPMRLARPGSGCTGT